MNDMQTTLCYIEKDGRTLMLHRVKKKNDMNRDKWLGVGGKFEPGESPEECMLREAKCAAAALGRRGLRVTVVERLPRAGHSAGL